MNVNIFRGRKFSEEKFKEAKEKVIAFLKGKGYRDAYVLGDTVFSAGRSRVNVALGIYLGKKYYVRSIRWRGNTLYDSAYLTRILGIGAGDIYSLAELNKRL